MVAMFRLIGLLEAFSFLILLLIAMPLKYIWGQPEAVKIVGAAHGGLFLLYGFFAVVLSQKLKWTFGTLMFAWIAAVVPLGTIVFDRKFLRS